MGRREGQRHQPTSLLPLRRLGGSMSPRGLTGITRGALSVSKRSKRKSYSCPRPSKQALNTHEPSVRLPCWLTDSAKAVCGVQTHVSTLRKRGASAEEQPDQHPKAFESCFSKRGDWLFGWCLVRGKRGVWVDLAKGKGKGKGNEGKRQRGPSNQHEGGQ